MDKPDCMFFILNHCEGHYHLPGLIVVAKPESNFPSLRAVVQREPRILTHRCTKENMRGPWIILRGSAERISLRAVRRNQNT